MISAKKQNHSQHLSLKKYLFEQPSIHEIPSQGLRNSGESMQYLSAHRSKKRCIEEGRKDSFTSPIFYGLNVCVLPKFIDWNLMLTVIGTEGRDFERPHITHVLWSECLCSPKIHRLKSNVHCDGNWNRAFERPLGGGALTCEISIIIKEGQESSPALSTTWGHKKSALCNAPEPDQASTLILVCSLQDTVFIILSV